MSLCIDAFFLCFRRFFAHNIKVQLSETHEGSVHDAAFHRIQVQVQAQTFTNLQLINYNSHLSRILYPTLTSVVVIQHLAKMKDQIVGRGYGSCSIVTEAILDAGQNSCHHECKLDIELTVFQCVMRFTYLMEYSSVFHSHVRQSYWCSLKWIKL